MQGLDRLTHRRSPCKRLGATGQGKEIFFSSVKLQTGSVYYSGLHLCGAENKPRGLTDHSPPSAADTSTTLSMHVWPREQGQTYLLILSYLIRRRARKYWLLYSQTARNMSVLHQGFKPATLSPALKKHHQDRPGIIVETILNVILRSIRLHLSLNWSLS